MRAGTSIVVAVGCALALASCGTTRIMTNDPTARIYVNGAFVGQGQAEIDRRGPPRTAEVSVQAPDGRSESITIKRRFTSSTFMYGLVTYMVGWMSLWEYPETVQVALPVPAQQQQQQPGASWDQAGGGDAWMSPPPGWGPAGSPSESPDQAPEELPDQQPPQPAPADQVPQNGSAWQ